MIHIRHMRWNRSRVWQRVFEHLAADSDNEYAMLDATLICAHQSSAGAKRGDRASEKIGRSKGELNNRLYTLRCAWKSCRLPPHARSSA